MTQRDPFTDLQSGWSTCGGRTNVVLNLPLTLDSARFAAMQISNLVLDVALRPCS